MEKDKEDNKEDNEEDDKEDNKEDDEEDDEEEYEDSYDEPATQNFPQDHDVRYQESCSYSDNGASKSEQFFQLVKRLLKIFLIIFMSTIFNLIVIKYQYS